MPSSSLPEQKASDPLTKMCFQLYPRYLADLSPDTHAIEKHAQHHATAELVATLRAPIDDPSGTFTHALDILASVQSSPSCNRIAASTLLDSCHSIENSEHDAESTVEDYRSIYAAQLAMCEIETVKSAKPQSCNALAVTTKTKSKDHRRITKSQLAHCLQSLESRPQWWTSYSNNRQNAGVMCQAARIDIEKGKLLSTMNHSR